MNCGIDWQGKTDPQCNSVTRIIGVTNHFLIGLKSLFTRKNPHMSLLSDQEPMTRQV